MILEELIEQNKKFNVKFFKVTVGDAEVSINIDSNECKSTTIDVPEDVIRRIKENPELIDFIRKYNNKD